VTVIDRAGISIHLASWSFSSVHWDGVPA